MYKIILVIVLKKDRMTGKKNKKQNKKQKIKHEQYYFLRMNLCGFIKVNQLHPNVKMKQHLMEHLPSIPENLVCVLHVSSDYELHYCHFS